MTSISKYFVEVLFWTFLVTFYHDLELKM